MSRTRIAALIAAASITATIFTATPPAVAAPVIELVTPAPGAVVNVGTLITARVDDAIPRELIDGVDFELSSNGQMFQQFGGPAPDGMREFQTLWDAGDMPSGTYNIRATLRLGTGNLPTRDVVPIELVQLNLVSSDPISVRVNTQPVAWAQASLLQPMHNQALILFTGQGMDSDGTVASYSWDFEDGTPADPNRVTQHMFPVPGRFPLSLTVTDDRRGRDIFHGEITTWSIPTPPFVSVSMIKKIKCKCKSMDVKTAGAVEGGQSFAPESDSGIPAADQGALGPYNDGAAGGPPPTLPGAGPWNVQCRFQVIAVLEKFSEPQLCPEGQRVKRTGELGASGPQPKVGELSSDARYDSASGTNDPYDPADNPVVVEQGRCGHLGTRYCDDDYHGGGGPGGEGRSGKDPPNPFKKYEGQTRIMWLDAPGLARITAADLAAGGAYYDAVFEAKVGECKCTWEVHIVVNRAGQIIQNEVTKKVCS